MRGSSGTILALLIAFAFGECAAQAQETSPPTKKEASEQKAIDPKAIAALVKQLGDDVFEKREAAEKELAKIGLPALELLRKTAAEGADLETRERAGRLTRQIGQLLLRPTLKDKLWGESVDPDGDCLFRLDQDKLHIKIPGVPHRMGSELKATNAPRVLRDVDGDFEVQVEVTGPVPLLNRNLIGKYPWYGAGILVWQDDNNFFRLERARIIFGANNGPTYANWELRERGQHVRKGANEEGRLSDSDNAHLKLTRKGNIFSAAYSQDGKEWKELPSITANFAKKLRVGLIATQNTPMGFEAVFERLKLTPAK